jgi:fucose 4-O-acetylase-like acetyltransferase
MDNRADWVDYAKAIGIVLVVYGHVARGVFNAGIEFQESIYRSIDSIIYSFHMPLFFFLSGLFFYQSLLKRGGKSLIFNKIDTIIYPYLVWSIFQGLIQVFLSKYTNSNVSLYEVFSLIWEPRAQFWFLYALFILFVVSTLIYTKIKVDSVMFFIPAAILYIFPGLLPELNVFNFISQGLVFFCFGLFFTQYFKIETFSNFRVFTGLLSLFIVGQWLFHFYFLLDYTNKGLPSLMLAIISIILIVSGSSLLAQRRYQFIRVIGASSMIIYLMHILAGSGVRVLLSKLLHIDSLFVHIFLGCIVGVLAPVVFLVVINKLKIQYVFSAPLCLGIKSLYNKASWKCK